MRAVVTPHFLGRFSALPSPSFYPIIAWATRAVMHVNRFRVDVDGAPPAQPSLLCTNSTHRYDFLALMKAVDQLPRSGRVVTVSKAKNYQSGPLAFVMARSGTVPLASRGYFIAADFVALRGTRPSDAQYRALRAHVDDDAPLPADLVDVLRVPRAIAGRAFDPAAQTYRAAIEGAFAHGAQQSLHIARTAIAAGFHVQIYPEGTVSSTGRLGVGRRGAVQLAHALGVPLVPVGMNGAQRAFRGAVPWRAHVRVHFGVPVDVTLPRAHRPFVKEDERAHAAFLDAGTARLMGAIDALLEPPHRRVPAGAGPGGAVASTATSHL
jgi:1-acyl-sn-glycerol-3-phosphate acyltransferase